MQNLFWLIVAGVILYMVYTLVMSGVTSLDAGTCSAVEQALKACTGR